MFANKFPSPYIDILKLFEKNWELAELSGDVQLAIDKVIGKKVFALRGVTAATNYLSLPRPSSAGLGLTSPLLYLQICIQPTAHFSLHLDVTTARKFVRRITISSRYTSIKRVGTVVQLPCPDLLRHTAGRWAVLALDLHSIARAVLPLSDGEYTSLKALVACATMSLRAAFITDRVYTPDTLPREFLLPLPGGSTFGANYEWLWLPSEPEPPPPPPPAALPAPQGASPPVAKASSRSPATGPATAGAPPSRYQAARKRRAASGAAPRALFKPPTPAAPADPNLLELSRVLGFSGEKLHLLVWLADGRRIMYASAALIVIQEIDSAKQTFLMGAAFGGTRTAHAGGTRSTICAHRRTIRTHRGTICTHRTTTGSHRRITNTILFTPSSQFHLPVHTTPCPPAGHTENIVALSAAESSPLVASAQEGALPLIRLWDRDLGVPLAILQQHACDMHSLDLTADGTLLAAVGKDRRGAQMLAVWDVSQAGAARPSCPLLDARVSLVHVKALKWIPLLTALGIPLLTPLGATWQVHVKALKWVPADPLDAFQKEADGACSPASSHHLPPSPDITRRHPTSPAISRHLPPLTARASSSLFFYRPISERCCPVDHVRLRERALLAVASRQAARVRHGAAGEICGRYEGDMGRYAASCTRAA